MHLSHFIYLRCKCNIKECPDQQTVLKPITVMRSSGMCTCVDVFPCIWLCFTMWMWSCLCVLMHPVCVCVWMELSMMAEQLTTVRLSTFSTIRTEWLSEYLALLLPSSKPFDVCSQQLCINGPRANQKPTRTPYTLAQYCKTLDSLIWVTRSFCDQWMMNWNRKCGLLWIQEFLMSLCMQCIYHVWSLNLACIYGDSAALAFL